MKNLSAPAPTIVDRLFAAVAPRFAVRRYQARVALAMMGQYGGAKSSKSALKAWHTYAGSADADALGDLFVLRARSRDLNRNNPIAAGARKTTKLHTVGTGLRLRAQVDREALGMSPDAADAWERKTESLFHKWASSPACDITTVDNFYALQGLVFATAFESGDCLVLRRRPKLPSVVPTALQIIEADRIGTPMTETANPAIRSGVKLDQDGAPISYFVFDFHPGDYTMQSALDFIEVPATGPNSGERCALHVYQRLRPEQTRGIPELAPVIEILKQLDRYTEAEIMAAVVASFFTVFLKTNDGSGLAQPDAISGLNLSPDEVALGPGSVVALNQGEDVEMANPGRTNTNFDPFFTAIVRQIGVALGIPYELLIMHFTASYSASRAAIEMASKFFAERQEWLVQKLCAPVYEWFMSDAISAGLIEAPGFFESTALRAAWLGSKWIPPVGIAIDYEKELKGDQLAIEVGVDTIENVTLKRTGGDWRAVTEQRAREHAIRSAAKLETDVLGQKDAVVQDREQNNVDPEGGATKPAGGKGK